MSNPLDEVLSRMAQAGYPMTEDFIRLNDPTILDPVSTAELETLDEAIARHQAGGKPKKKGKPFDISRLKGEALMQARVIEWARNPKTLTVFPALEWLVHFPNGGGRSSREGAEFKALGVLPGPCDLMLPVRGGPVNTLGQPRYTAWWGELKWGKNGIGPRQQQFMDFVRGQGAFAKTFWDDPELVKNSLIHYLEGREP